MTEPIFPTFILGVLPARWGSTRFPGKPLHQIGGKPLIQHVWERCKECTRLDEIIVATDDERIRDVVTAFGGKVVMTSPNHPTGTDRIAEAAQAVPQATHIINIQGDEPLIDPALIDELAATMAAHPSLDMATAAIPRMSPYKTQPSSKSQSRLMVARCISLARRCHISAIPSPGCPCFDTKESTLTNESFTKLSSLGRRRRLKSPSHSNNFVHWRTELRLKF